MRRFLTLLHQDLVKQMENNSIKLFGVAASQGIAFGKAYLYRPNSLENFQTCFKEQAATARITAFEKAIKSAHKELEELYVGLFSKNSPDAKIFEAQQEILQDEEMKESVLQAITEEHLEPHIAINTVFSQFATMLESVSDPLISARAADIRDVGQRLIRILLQKEALDLSALPFGSILVAYDLLPSDTASLDRTRVEGLVAVTGNITSHTAIISRSMRIPAVLGVTDAMEKLHDGTFLALDGTSGIVYVDPTSEELEELRRSAKEYKDSSRKAEAYRLKKAITTDGVAVDIGINIGKPGKNFESCDFCGLFRTEFLFLDKAAMPDEEAQFLEYRRAVEIACGKYITVRTMDIGGDKSLPYLSMPKEDNPFLGNRALRLCLQYPELFIAQLRAILRASAFGPIKLMYPMVSSLDDFRRAKAITKSVMKELDSQGIAFDHHIEQGIMIETPSISEISDIVAREVDFASVGTNDLCQYLCAADRLNSDVSEYYQTFSPAMLRCLARIAAAFTSAGKPLSICGEMGGDPRATKLLIGMGYRKLSMDATNHDAVKAAVCQMSSEEAKQLAVAALACATQEEVFSLIKE